MRERRSLAELPLFPDGLPEWIQAYVRRLANTPEWFFWLDWYEGLLEGREQNWPLLLEIAAQDNGFWQASDSEVNARIAEIVERHALSVSYAARRVVVNEPTKLLRAEVVSDIEPGFFLIVLGRLGDAVDEMRAAPSFTNQYTAMEPELRRIEDYLKRHPDKPLRIYEIAERTVRLIDLKIKDGQLPENDPILEDFKTEVDNSGLDILHGDREVAEVIRKRSTGRFDRLDRQQKEHYRAITPKIALICEDSLAEELKAEIATANDTAASPEEQKEAMWRWAGLMLRIFRIVRHRVHDYAAYVTLASAERGAIISYLL